MFNIIGGILATPAAVLIGAIIGILVLLARGFAWISAALLNWVTGPAFFSWSYTNNPVVKIGLNITQEFVNLILVVILVFIAIGITLRLKEYSVQKILVRLIIIALLVNFAPVLVGLIVDASNIVMNFFLVEIEEKTFNILSQIDEKTVMATVTEIFNVVSGDLITKGSILTKGMVYAILYTFIGLAFFLLAIIFLFRYIAIWLLVILSPLAFVAWILPATKKFWDMWWKQLIQWSIIGIPMAFFLYLALSSFDGLSAHFKAEMTLPGLKGDPAWFNNIFPYFMVLTLLYLGFFIGLSTSAFGASSAIRLAKWSGQKTAGGIKLATRQTAGRFLASEKGKKAMKYIKRLRIPTMREAIKMETKGVKMGELKRAGIFIGGAVTTVSGARWALRGVTKVGAVYGATQEKRIQEEKKKIEQQFGKDYGRAAMTYDSILPYNYHKKIAMARYLAETKGGKALEGLEEKELDEAVRLNATYSPATIEDIVKHKQELINKDEIGDIIKKTMVGKTPETQMDNKDVKALMNLGMNAAQAVEKAAFKKATDALKEKDVENLTDKIKDMSEFQEMTARFKNWSFIRKVGEEKGLDWLEKIQKKAQEIGIKEISRSNPSFIKAAYTPAGTMFLSPWKDAKGKTINREEINRIIQQAVPVLLDEKIKEEKIKKERDEYIRTKKAEKKTGPSPQKEKTEPITATEAIKEKLRRGKKK